MALPQWWQPKNFTRRRTSSSRREPNPGSEYFFPNIPYPSRHFSSLDIPDITRLILVDAQHQDRLGHLEKVT